MNNEINLDFTGPHDVSEYFDIDLNNEKVSLKNTLPVNGIVKGKSGFYIWGFKSPGGFVPYYVGKIQNCILSRIKSHIFDIIKWDSSSIRLSSDYLFGTDKTIPFYMDKLFMPDEKWIFSDILPKWLKDEQSHFEGKIIYCNNKEFFEKFYRMSELTKDRYSRGYPISNLGLNRQKDDSLYSNINNMFFICSEYDVPTTCADRNDIYETIESYIKYSLKGKTVCNVLNYSTMIDKIKNKYGYKVCLNCDDPINYLFKGCADHGYYPGYGRGQ